MSDETQALVTSTTDVAVAEPAPASAPSLDLWGIYSGAKEGPGSQEPPHETDRGPDTGATRDLYQILQQARPQEPGAPLDYQGLVGDYFTNEKGDAYEFLGRLHDVSQGGEKYAAIVDAVLDTYAPQILDALVRANILPPESLYDPAPPPINPAILAQIPERLREYASTLEAEMFEKVAAMPPHMRDQVLESGMELEYLRQAEEQRICEEVDKECEEKFNGAMSKAAESADNLAAEFRAGHLLHLEQTFSPHADKEANRRLHELILSAAMWHVLRDPEAEMMNHNITAHFAHAAFQSRFDCRGPGSDSEARRLAETLNARVTAARDAFVTLFRNNFSS